MFKKMMENKKILHSAGFMTVCAVMVVLVFYVLFLLLNGTSVAWFAQNRDVKAGEIDVKVNSLDFLKVTLVNDKNAPDIEELEEEERIIFTQAVTETSSDGKVVPGSYGELSFYVTYISEEGKKYNLTVSPEVLNDVTYSTENHMITEGYTTALSDKLNEALGYIQTHIAFFTSYNAETGSFSGYFTASDPLTMELTAGETEEIKIYWVWVEDINAVLGNAELKASLLESPEQWCYQTPTQDSEQVIDLSEVVSDLTEENRSILNAFYDNADLLIAKVLRKITFFFNLT